jgi:hypothetical protein
MVAAISAQGSHTDGQPTSCHFMFVWEENLLQKRIWSAFFSLLLQSLVLVWQLCTVLLCFMLRDSILMAQRKSRPLTGCLSSCRFASFARSALRGCLVRSPKQTNKHRENFFFFFLCSSHYENQQTNILIAHQLTRIPTPLTISDISIQSVRLSIGFFRRISRKNVWIIC